MIISRLFAAAVVTAICVSACEAPQYDPEPATETAIDTTEEDFSMNNKIGTALRQALGERTDSITFLVKVDTAAAPDAADRLASAGCDIRTKAGDIYTANAPPAVIRAVAELPFVTSLQLSETRSPRP